MTAVSDAQLAAPVDTAPSLSSSSSTSSLIPALAVVGRVSATASGPVTAGFKGVTPAAGGHHSGGGGPKAVLRQHGGGASSAKNTSLSSNKAMPDEPLPDPATCEVKPGKETTIEVNKDKLGLGLSIVGGSDTLLVTLTTHYFYKTHLLYLII